MLGKVLNKLGFGIDFASLVKAAKGGLGPGKLSYLRGIRRPFDNIKDEGSRVDVMESPEEATNTFIFKDVQAPEGNFYVGWARYPKQKGRGRKGRGEGLISDLTWQVRSMMHFLSGVFR
jgi:hypothetical protein